MPQSKPKTPNKKITLEMLYWPKASDMDFLNTYTKSIAQNRSEVVSLFAEMASEFQQPISESEADHLMTVGANIGSLAIWNEAGIEQFATLTAKKVQPTVMAALLAGFPSALRAKIKKKNRGKNEAELKLEEIVIEDDIDTEIASIKSKSTDTLFQKFGVKGSLAPELLYLISQRKASLPEKEKSSGLSDSKAEGQITLIRDGGDFLEYMIIGQNALGKLEIAESGETEAIGQQIVRSKVPVTAGQRGRLARSMRWHKLRLKIKRKR